MENENINKYLNMAHELAEEALREHETLDKASKTISEYMSMIGKRGVQGKLKKYGYDERGKSIFFSKIAKNRWKNKK